MPPPEHGTGGLSYDREVTPASTGPYRVMRYSGPPESPGQVSMPMPPAPSSPAGCAPALQPGEVEQSASVIVELASWSSLTNWSPVVLIAPNPTSEIAAPFTRSRRAQPVTILRGARLEARAST